MPNQQLILPARIKLLGFAVGATYPTSYVKGTFNPEQGADNVLPEMVIFEMEDLCIVISVGMHI